MSDAIDFNSRVIVPDDTLVRELDGEAVLLNLASERYYGLNKVGTRMWKVLEKSPSVQSALETLIGEYDVEPERLRGDVRALVGELVGQGLIRLESPHG